MKRKRKRHPVGGVLPPSLVSVAASSVETSREAGWHPKKKKKKKKRRRRKRRKRKNHLHRSSSQQPRLRLRVMGEACEDTRVRHPRGRAQSSHGARLRGGGGG